uniref:Ankyrin repeat-containing protein DDB_G0279043 n=1 Tax=Cacopsylla melanoneura TaxID=428564 RepID=A0A8D8YVQ6_9HEMI
MDNGAYVNCCDTNGKTPLQIAVQNNDTEMVHMLLDKGANVNGCDVDGKTPLHFALQNKDLEMVQILLDKGSDVIEQHYDDLLYHNYLHIEEKHVGETFFLEVISR